MKKITFGIPESLTPVTFCKNFSYEEGKISYPTHLITFRKNQRGCVLTLPLEENEQIYGMGLQLKVFDLRGKKITLRPNADPVAKTGDSHAPVPFFVSTAGYGIFVDTARYAEFYFGSSEFLTPHQNTTEHAELAESTDDLYAYGGTGKSNISIQIPVAEGVDIYIMEGKNITDVVSQYNRMSGGGCSSPEWGLSAIYRCYLRYTQDEVIAAATALKEAKLPIGIIGLEPGWHSKSYSCSHAWSPERFPEPKKFLDTMREMGYHVNLWGHAFTHPTSPIYENLLPYSGNYSVWNGCVPDFATAEGRKIFAEHYRKIVEMGIDGFKLDECDSSDITGSWSFPNLAEFPSGLDGEQYHSLFGVLYMQTILDALGEHETFSEVRNAGALSASYPFVLYSDLYDHKDFICGCATAGFSGILWTPEVRDAKSRDEFLRRLQANVFSVQCLINAYYCKTFPWLDWDCTEEVRYWIEVRESLKPMLKEAFDRYKTTGIPPVRALVSDYSDDVETYKIADQYIFCDKLIVAPILVGQTEREVYLPAGQWRNYFTKEPVPCGHFTVKTDSIPVYEKL